MASPEFRSRDKNRTSSKGPRQGVAKKPKPRPAKNALKKSSAVKQIRNHFARYSKKPNAKDDLIVRNIGIFGKELGMSVVEKDILCVVMRCDQMDALDTLMDDLLNVFYSISVTLACVLGVNNTEVHQLIMPSSLLMKSGVLEIDFSCNSFSGEYGGCVNILSGLKRCILRPYQTIEEMQSDLFGLPGKTDLEWIDFEHLGHEAEFARKLIDGAVSQGVKGVNILLYGPPGTGKTEFSKALAKENCNNLISIGEASDSGNEASRGERLNKLSLAQHLLHKSSSTVLLMDEMEDIVSDNPFSRHVSAKRGSASGSLVYLHRILEETPVPVIWTANHIDSIRPSVLRRFTNAIEFKVPSATVRSRLWSRMLSDAKIDIAASDIDHLAREFDAPPGVLANAVIATKCVDGGIDDLRHAAFQIVKTVRGGIPVSPKPHQAVAFNQKLLNADLNLEKLTEAIGHAGDSSGVSLCLFGPPGTGKTAYVKYLAASMGMEILQKRASDLFSKWIGETEQAIAGAFDEAKTAKKFLVFDEADSLLQDRTGAQRSWEVTQVNEMLTWMEVHELPFACTTNLIDSLDRASLRRFTFKVGFKTLSNTQVRLAFRHYFNLDLPREREGVENLVPGDFAVVKSKAKILNIDDNPIELMKMLQIESSLKSGNKKPIGFNSKL